MLTWPKLYLIWSYYIRMGIHILPPTARRTVTYDPVLSYFPCHFCGNFWPQVMVLAQNWGASYFHFLIECLPRITLMLDVLHRFPDIKVQPELVLTFRKWTIGSFATWCCFTSIRGNDVKVLHLLLPRPGTLSSSTLFSYPRATKATSLLPPTKMIKWMIKWEIMEKRLFGSLLPRHQFKSTHKLFISAFIS